MSSEETLRELEANLAKADAINQMLEHSFESFDTAKSGNGWGSDLLPEENIYAFKPMPADAAIAAADEKKTGLFGTLGGLFGKPKPEEVKNVDKTLWYYPYWLVEGIHSIFYFRSANYKVQLNDDVLGVVVEGKQRDLIAEAKAGIGKVIPTNRLFQRLTQPKSKHFTVDDAIEFAFATNAAMLYLDQRGEQSDEFKQLIEEKRPVVSGSNRTGLKMRGTKTEFSETTGGKDLVARRLQEKVVTKPKVMSRVWQNILEVIRLELYLRPVYKFSFQYKDKVKEVEIDGIATG